ncbi:glycosyltransferase [Synechococcus sp. CBW1004]|uniref:glycosyltransferase n=1 Tax=Synechococcus sp. CBW1004 TaxID=1353136 RepID=UPI0018CFABC8|nr:glycosyltransferase [Synechococcus sp. CBW1004]QPN64296.1 glycosyltransferase [Synechococcus sp. CBW1004]
MASELSFIGCDVSILTTNDDGPGLDTSLPHGHWSERNGVPVLAFNRWSPPLQPLREYAVSPALNRWLAAHLRDYDLLHVHAMFSWPSTSAMAQARRAGVPYVVSTIGQLCRWSLARSPRRKQLLLRLIERRNLEGAAALHFTTEAEREEAADLGLGSPSFVLPLGVLPPSSPTNAPNQTPAAGLRDPLIGPVFLFLSRLHPKKQLEMLLEALALLQQRQPEAAWQLQIAGTGEPSYLNTLHRQAAALGLAGRCRWLGFLEGEAKWQALRRADWFVLPSASENFGIAAIEALAAGTPTILSPGVAVSEAIAAAQAGHVCDSEPLALSQALEAALAGPPAAMRAAALDLATRAYSWPAIAMRLEETYLSILSGERPLRSASAIEDGAEIARPAPTP